MSRDQRQAPSVDLQERTLKVLSIPPMTTRSVLFELFNQVMLIEELAVSRCRPLNSFESLLLIGIS